MKIRKRMTRAVWLAALAAAGAGGLGPVLAQEVDGVGRGRVEAGHDPLGEPRQAIIFVDADAAGADDGSSWADAFNDLQGALDVAVNGDQIWVATGTYTPSARTDPDDPRSATFQLANGVAIYGGFFGTEAALDERAGLFDQTILSGDLNGNDGDGGNCCVVHEAPGCDDEVREEEVCSSQPSCCSTTWDQTCVCRAMMPWPSGPCQAPRTENCYTVVLGSWTLATAILDGFTITASYSDRSAGGGMFISRGSPTLANCTFSGNFADAAGAILIDRGDPTLTNCTFSGNCTSDRGGAIWEITSNPTMINCTFTDNWASP